MGATYELSLEPGKALVFVPRFDLALNALSISASEGGSVVFSLNAGPANGGRAFQLSGSNSGTDPCTPIGSVCVPIVTDAITLVLQQPPTSAC